MDGAAALAALKKRLGIEGMTDEALDDTELYQDLTFARDELRDDLALAAPLVVQEDIVLQLSTLLEAIGTLAVSGTAEKFKTTTTATYRVKGVPYTKIATDLLTFSVAGTINNAAVAGIFYGAWLVQITAAGVVSTKPAGGLADQVYTSAALALDALPAEDADCVAMGSIVVGAKTGVKWTAGTDDMTAGSDCSSVVVADAAIGVYSDRDYWLPDAALDPVRKMVLKDRTVGEELRPSARLDQDGGEYLWLSPRCVRLAAHVDPPGGLVGTFILAYGAIGATTPEHRMGLPTPWHRCLVLGAAVYALTVNEDSPATTAFSLYEKTKDRLMRAASEYDADGGQALREVLMESLGEWQGDSLY
jgi:hypothetical protein